jgi:hypothetical protein
MTYRGGVRVNPRGLWRHFYERQVVPRGTSNADAERTPKAQATLGEVGMTTTPVVGKGPTNEKEARAFINSAKKTGRGE